MDSLFRMLCLLTAGGTLLGLLLLTVRYLLFRRMPSTFYYYAWLLVLIRFLLPVPGLVPVERAQPAPEPTAVVTETRPPVQLPQFSRPDPVSTQSPPAVTEPAASVPVVPKAQNTQIFRSSAFWLGIWALGAVVSFLCYVIGYHLFASEIRKHIRRPQGWDERIFAGIPGKKPDLWRCDGVYSPMLLGLIHPMIVLPEGDFEGQTMQNILRHELMHYQRRDIFYKWFSVVVFSVQWFNPMIYVIRHELNRACELSCDEMLIRSMDREQKQAYGETLLTLAANRTLPANVTATTFATEKRNLKERLLQIMSYKVSMGTMLTAMVVVTALTLCGAAAGPRFAASFSHAAAGARNLDSKQPIAGSGKMLETAQAAFAYEMNSDTLLYAYEPDTRVIPGCTSKLALALTVLEICDPEETVIVSENDFYELPQNVNNVHLKAGEELTVNDLLHAVLLGNAGDAAVTLAEHAAGSVDGFLPKMNDWVRKNGCRNTYYTDLFGLAEGQYTTARDTAKLIYAVRNHPFLGEIWQKDAYAFEKTNMSSYRVVLRDNFQLNDKLNAVSGQTEIDGISDVIPNGENSFLCSCVGTVTDGNADIVYVVLNAEERIAEDGWEVLYYGHIEEAAQMISTLLEGYTMDPESGKMTETAEEPIEQESFGPTGSFDAEGRKVMRIQTVDELLSSIESDRTLILEEGDFNLREASTYGKTKIDHHENYHWEEVNDGFQLVIENVSNFRILAESDSVRLLAVPRYANIIQFRNCSDCELTFLTAGHTPDKGYCTGGVIQLDSCQRMKVLDCALFGCGTVGVDVRYSTDVTVSGCEIYECTQGAIFLDTSRGVTIFGNTIRDIGKSVGGINYGQVLEANASKGISFRENRIVDSHCSGLLYANNCSDLYFLSTKVENNSFRSLFWLEGSHVVVDGSRFADNQFSRWFQNANTRIQDLYANDLTEEDLETMEYRTEIQVIEEKPSIGTVTSFTVHNIDEFLNALGSDREIILASGDYDLSKASTYGQKLSACYDWLEVYGGYELQISGMENLTILGDISGPSRAEFRTENNSCAVLRFLNCQNLSVCGLDLIQEGANGTGLLMNNCSDTLVCQCRFPGRYNWALDARQCSNLTLTDCEFLHGTDGGVDMFHCDRIHLERCSFQNLDGCGIRAYGSRELTTDQCTFENVKGENIYNIG